MERSVVPWQTLKRDGIMKNCDVCFVPGAAIEDEAEREPDQTLPGSCFHPQLPGRASVRVPKWPL